MSLLYAKAAVETEPISWRSYDFAEGNFHFTPGIELYSTAVHGSSSEETMQSVTKQYFEDVTQGIKDTGLHIWQVLERKKKE